MLEPNVRRSPSMTAQRDSLVAFSRDHDRRIASPEDPAYESDRGNVFDTPPRSPSLESENVFATPINSRPNSMRSLEDEYDDGLSLHGSGSSLSLSGSRSLSPLPVADGWGGSHLMHRRSVSLSRSATPSLSAGTLRRSDTANTHTTNASSILSSSRASAAPSSLRSIAPARPRFDYGGHQQTLSINGSELEDNDPFEQLLELDDVVLDGAGPTPPPSEVGREAAQHQTTPAHRVERA